MEIVVSRVQLALNVSNLAEAIQFYSKMFNATPAKVREGYANFAIADPPLKLVLIEGHGLAAEDHGLWQRLCCTDFHWLRSRAGSNGA